MGNQQKPWLYYLVDDQGRSFRKEMGLILAKSDRRPLRYTVDGWQDISFGWERDLYKWGVTRQFSLPLGFVLDGADIMRTLMYIGNFEKKVYLIIQKQYLSLTSTEYYYYYDLFYKGQLALDKAVDEEDKVTCEIKEGGLIQDMKANSATEYEFDVDEVTVMMDGINLAEAATLEVLDVVVGTTQELASHYVPIAFISGEGDLPGLLFQSQSISGVTESDQFFVKNVNTESIIIQLTGSVTWHTNDQVQVSTIRLQRITASNVATVLKSDTHNPAVPNTDYTFSLNETILLTPGSRLTLTLQMIGVPAQLPATRATYTQTELTAVYNYRKEATFIKALFPLTLFKRLISKISPTSTATSALLTTFRNFVITSGDAIRGLDKSKIKIKYDDFYKAITGVLGASEQILGSQISIETFASALVEANIISLGEVKEIKTSRKQELIYNTVKTGYEPQTYDDVNGKQEFNNTSSYTSDVKAETQELDLTSPIRADSYGIEFLRINLAGKKTTDSGSDNDTFFIDIDIDHPQQDAEHGIYYNLFRESYDTITGLLTPNTVFNIRLSPARNLRRNMPLINSLFYGFEGTKLVFQTTDKNRDLFTSKAGEIFDEDADVTITAQGRVFKPFEFDFQPETPVRLVEDLATNPNRCFSFIHYNGRTYTGFSIKIGIAANSLESQAYLLLSCNSNDLTTLVT